VAIDELWLCRPLLEAPQQRASVRRRPANNTVCVCANQQRTTAVSVIPNHRMLHGSCHTAPAPAALFGRMTRRAGSLNRLEITGLGDSRAYGNGAAWDSRVALHHSQVISLPLFRSILHLGVLLECRWSRTT
jgi:hypothetical protein